MYHGKRAVAKVLFTKDDNYTQKEKEIQALRHVEHQLKTAPAWVRKHFPKLYEIIHDQRIMFSLS